MIYFSLALSLGRIKIGYTSKSPAERLTSLQATCPDSLQMLAWREGTEADEAALHRRFSRCKVRGEWFRPDPELVQHIAEASIKEPLAFHGLAEIEPALLALWVKAVSTHALTGDHFCANARWYGYGSFQGDGIKELLCRLVGWEARESRLRTHTAYDVAYDTLYDLLPDCRRCACCGSAEVAG